MWQQFKRFFVFRSKALEFKYRTWESRRAIRRAYREGSVPARLFSAARVHTRTIVLALGGCVVIIAAVLVGPKSVVYLTNAYNEARVTAAADRAVAVEAQRARQAKREATAESAPEKKEKIKEPLSPAPLSDTSTAKEIKGQAGGKAAGQALAPATEATAPGEESRYCVLANKATKTVFLLSISSLEGTWKIVERFPAVMGRNEGQKQTAGDRRTPEGIYFIIGRKEKAELSPLYGPMAYVLNYPNEEDRKAGRTGQGIWIHGMPEDSSRMVTHGCIVMQNIWLMALERYLKLGVGTPVVIVDKPDLVSPEKYPDFGQIEQKRKTILQDYVRQEQDFKSLLREWKTAWASRDIDAYSQFYDTQRFFSSGMSWNAWRERKKSIFQSFDTIEISVDNVRLVDCSESTAVVVFRQQYAASLQAAKQNAKRLCFYKNVGRWLIYREETFSTEEFLL
jgi:murein L,D-transpeptidase YafK